MSIHPLPVAILGLGSMGLALANALVKSGYQVTVWNRTIDRPNVKIAVGSGASFEPDVGDAIKHTACVIVCVLDYKSVYDILKQTDADFNGKTIVNLTNGLPSEARQMSTFIHERYNVAAYFDGAIMTTPQLVGTEQSFIFLSGETEITLDQDVGPEQNSGTTRSLISNLGRVDYRGQDPGQASLYDLALLAGMYAMFGGAMTATGLLYRGDKNALPAPSEKYMGSGLATIVGESLVPMLQALLPDLVKMAASAELEEYGAHGHANSMLTAGLRNIVQACEEENVEAGGLTRLLEIFQGTVSEGGGENGIGLVARKFLL